MLTGKWLLFLKGIPIGISNVLPGISGGTLALVLNIYEELLDSIRSLRWQFILPLAAGIATGILLTAKLFTYLLEHYPEFITAVLFGLILSSAIYTRKEITRINVYSVLSIILGITAAIGVILLNHEQTIGIQEMGWWGVAIAGFLASISMLLPGISGATVLILMGMYEYILDALTTFQMNIISIFALFAALGIICLSWALSYVLKNYRNTLMGLLTGLILGSSAAVLPSSAGLSEFIGVLLGGIIVIGLGKLGKAA